MAIYGLFVGINEYSNPRVNDLNGCKNDVDLISKTLVKRYAIPKDNIHILLNDSATKQRIVSGFQNHLAQAGPDDTALFYFSGHGSQEQVDSSMRVIEEDGFNETLVCHDSRAAEPYDLADKEIRYLIHQLSANGAKVVTIIDSCHSGDATRVLESEDTDETTRRQSPDTDRTRPLESYLFYNDPAMQDWKDNFRLMPEGPHIALGACQNEELAKEKNFRSRKYGTFTYALCYKLEFERETPSYYNLTDAVQQLVKGLVNFQTPQLQAIGEWDFTQTFLGTELQPVHYQVSYENNRWQLNAGVTQGINRNARLRIGADGDAIDIIVEDALPDISFLRVVGGNTLRQGQHAAVMVDPAQPKLPIILSGSDANIAPLRALLSQAPYVYDLQEADSANYRINANETAPSFERISLPLAAPKPETLDDTKLVLDMARHMAKWERSRQLSYAIGDIPADLVQLVIEQYDPETDAYKAFNASDSVVELAYTKSNGGYDRPKVKISLHLNTSYEWPNDVYVSLLMYDQITGSIIDLFKRKDGVVLRQYERVGGEGKIKRARHEIYYTKPNGKTEVTFSLPQTLKDAKIDRVSDYFKLFVSTQPLSVTSQVLDSLEAKVKSLRGTSRGGDFGSDDDTPYYQARTQTIAVDTHHPAIKSNLEQNKGIDDSGKPSNSNIASPTRGIKSDPVTFSALAPSSVLPGEYCLVDIWAHLPNQLDAVIRSAKDKGQDAMIGAKAGIILPTDTALSVVLHIPGLNIDDPIQMLNWNGEATNASFLVEVPHDVKRLGKQPGKATVYIDGVQIASIPLLLNIGYETSPQTVSAGDTHYPKSAFASYSSENRDEVMMRLQGIEIAAPQLEIFVDVLSLRAGDDWQEQLAKNIESREVFYLFWSQHAASSEWVGKEWKMALQVKGLDSIQPVPLVEPSQAPPPEELASLHFNDRWLAYIGA